MKRITQVLFLMLVSFISVSCSLEGSSAKMNTWDTGEITTLVETDYAKCREIKNLYVEEVLYFEGRKVDLVRSLMEGDAFCTELEYEGGFDYKVESFKSTLSLSFSSGVLLHLSL